MTLTHDLYLQKIKEEPDIIDSYVTGDAWGECGVETHAWVLWSSTVWSMEGIHREGNHRRR